MNFRTTLILIVLLVVVAGLAMYWRAQDVADNGGSGAVATSDQPAELGFATPGALSAVTIRSGQSTLSLERSGDAWRITAPLAAAADRFEVETFLSRVILPAVTPTDIVSGDFVPAATVSLDAGGGRVRSFELSQPAATGDVFVRADGRVWVAGFGPTSMDRMTDLRALAGQLRSHELVAAASNDIHRIVVERDGQTIELEHGELGWRIVRPAEAAAVEASADEAEVARLLIAATGLKATSFPAGNSELGPEATTVELHVHREDATTQAEAGSGPRVLTLKIGGYQDIRRQSVLVTVEGEGQERTLAAVPAASVEAFRVTALELRTKEVVSIPATVTKVTVGRSQDGAVVDFPVARMEANSALAELLTAMRPLRALRYLEALPQGAPAYRIAFVGDDRTVNLDLHSPGPWVGVYNGTAFELPASVGSLVEQLLAPPVPAAATPQESK